MQYVLGFLLVITSIFMILLILVQRGRGGGLTGALGGMGGQSAFGTKAGDMFTKITMGTAVFWLLLCAAMLKIKNTDATLFSDTLGGNARQEVKADPKTPAGKSSGKEVDATKDGLDAKGTPSKSSTGKDSATEGTSHATTPLKPDSSAKPDATAKPDSTDKASAPPAPADTKPATDKPVEKPADPAPEKPATEKTEK